MSEADNDASSRSKPRSIAEFMIFLGLGGLAAATNLIVRYLLNFIMPFELAVVLAYMTGMVVAFILFGRLLFTGSKSAPARRISRFIQVNILGATLAWLVSIFMARVALPAVDWTFHTLEVAHLIGVAAPIITSYVLHKRYTFA
eukprot:Opistho-2@84992